MPRAAAEMASILIGFPEEADRVSKSRVAPHGDIGAEGVQFCIIQTTVMKPKRHFQLALLGIPVLLFSPADFLMKFTVLHVSVQLKKEAPEVINMCVEIGRSHPKILKGVIQWFQTR